MKFRSVQREIGDVVQIKSDEWYVWTGDEWRPMTEDEMLQLSVDDP